ncbi:MULTISPECIES: type II toxin-antitoxin system CcdA family antitoxin [unclassified Oceanispirochaeta]|uniref:type II toxin-antitoxin system CcdA family antitoxin n=1 Tax=unclassified Oceanispirochaeta TaxID=2635722 RepID=UPI001314FF43|nr:MULTISPECIES: type II toxin-antitoxin system CcdA family antitoxin [unclassified Oceanispirochaeta]MBF9017450.1 type II toxin-antitoxin system CcdA family antitoxin [Oceanispirochaeta sp. M2]NPD74022.1 type II toxin-antitoxin system CcdA family antitoxin [Oceanispirochaeta sp. M1]
MKTRTNVSIDKELLESAKSQNIVISTLLEKAIKDELKKKAEEDWVEENKANLNRYNQRITEDGVFSDELRTF